MGQLYLDDCGASLWKPMMQAQAACGVEVHACGICLHAYYQHRNWRRP